MDSWGDHALTCPCRGDRTVRHNVIRDLIHAEAKDAGCAPEKEKGHLLPGRSVEDGAPSRHDAPPRSDERRRPADIWFPRGVGERVARPAAVDFAVTSGLRADRVGRAQEGGKAIADDYAITKRAFQDTEEKCHAAGFSFLPLVFEAHGGGWGTQTRRTLGFLGQQLSATGEWCREGAPLRLAQRVSCSLHRETARAILRRLAPADTDAAVTPYEPEADGDA